MQLASLGGRRVAQTHPGAGAEARAVAGVRARGAGRRAGRDARLHLRLPRHRRPFARAARDHAAPPHGERQERLAAEAAAPLRPARARGARRAGTPPAEIASLLRAPLLGRELTPVAELRTRRSVVRLHGPDDALAEVVHDAVEVMEGRRVADRFAEVEVELVAGNGGSLRKLGKRVAKAGAEPSDGRPKVFRALGLTGTAEGLPADAPFAARLGEMLRSAGRRDSSQRPGSPARRRSRGRPRPSCRRPAPAGDPACRPEGASGPSGSSRCAGS